MIKNQRHAEFRRLYLVERLTLQAIGERFGVTKQAVHDALTRAGVKLRPKVRPSKPLNLNPDELRSMYIDQKMSLSRIAAALNVNWHVVRREFESLGIPLQNRQGPVRLPSPMDSLEVGQTALIKWEKPSYPQPTLHEAARARGFKIKTKKTGATTWCVTRLV